MERQIYTFNSSKKVCGLHGSTAIVFVYIMWIFIRSVGKGGQMGYFRVYIWVLYVCQSLCNLFYVNTGIISCLYLNVCIDQINYIQ